MATLGTAWIQIKPTVTGLSSSIKKELAGAEGSIGKTSSGLGSKISSGLVGGLKTVGAAALGTATAITGAIGGIVAKGGFDRAMSIEQAQFKLKGLGHSADAVESIMDNALASVKGTAYGLDEAATVAASAVAAGVKPGQELERTLKLVGDAATIGGVGMDEMGAIFNKVAANGKLTRQEINQLSDKGIPIIQLLADSMGKSTEEVNQLVSQGKIGFAEFQNAIETGMGGAALTMGQTFSGAVDNAKAALRRLGEGVMTPVMNELTPMIGAITGLIDDVAAGSTEHIDEQVAQISSFLESAITKLIDGLVPILETVVPMVIALFNKLVTMLPGIIQKLLPVVLNGAMQILYAVTDALPELFLMIVQALPTIISALTEFVIGVAKILTSPENLQIILQAGIELLLSLVKAIPDIITALVEALPEIIDNLITFFTDPNTIQQLVMASVQLFMALVKAVPQILGALFGAFGNLLGSLWSKLQGLFTNFVGNFGDTIGGIFKGAINGVLSFIENFLNGPIDVINSFIDTINNAFGSIGVNIGHIGHVSLGRLAQGGLVRGVGTDTSDSNLYALSKGEYVIKASSARSIGYDRLEQMNESGNVEGSSMINNITINGYNKDPNELADIISRKIALKQAGVLS